jgi:hypothetical protein
VLLFSFIVALGFFLFAFFIRIFRAHFYSLAESSFSLVNALLLKIDEDEKVKLVQKSNNRLLVSLLKILLSIVAALVIGSAPFIVYVILTGISYSDLEFSSTPSIIALTIGSTLGFIVPFKKKGAQSYPELSQLLHRMALDNYAVAYKLFRMEAKNLSKKEISDKNKFVIVSGLARAGTTSLMNKLSECGSFASLSYANMPFLTAPNIWKKFYKPKSRQKKERSHQDGIMIGLDSNEALEEYFFKVISNDAYINEDRLVRYDITDDQYSEYLKYQSVIRNDNKKVYLAKNNNFALRYESLRAHNDEFLMVLMFRDPVTHAGSLLEKHKYYSALQEEDDFVLEYMNWLGHHEFGLNQKTFQFTEAAPEYNSDKLSLDYWLQVWMNYYSYILTIDKKHVMFIDYDSYCSKPAEVLREVLQEAGVSAELPAVTPFQNKRKAELECSEELKKEAYAIFDQLKAHIRS